MKEKQRCVGTKERRNSVPVKKSKKQKKQVCCTENQFKTILCCTWLITCTYKLLLGISLFAKCHFLALLCFLFIFAI